MKLSLAYSLGYENDEVDAFLEREIAGEHLEGNIDPSPDVVYQCRLEQLAQLCAFMKRKYNSEYVWEHKRLSDDV